MHNSGFDNPYAHLQSSYERGKYQTSPYGTILHLLQNVIPSMTQNGKTIWSHFHIISIRVR